MPDGPKAGFKADCLSHEAVYLIRRGSKSTFASFWRPAICGWFERKPLGNHPILGGLSLETTPSGCSLTPKSLARKPRWRGQPRGFRPWARIRVTAEVGISLAVLGCLFAALFFFDFSFSPECCSKGSSSACCETTMKLLLQTNPLSTLMQQRQLAPTSNRSRILNQSKPSLQPAFKQPHGNPIPF